MGKTIATGFIADTIHGIRVNTSVSCNSKNCTNLTSRKIAYIVLHYTGNASDTAAANAQYFHSGSRGASAHFFVDNHSVYQSVELRDRAWHCGTTGTYYHNICRNSNSIGIEMCCSGNYQISEATKKNAAYLCAYLCKLLGISASQVDTYVLRHWDVTHKQCPLQMAGSGNSEWTAYKAMVKAILNGQNISNTSSLAAVTTASIHTAVNPYVVRVTASVLNVRSGPGTSYPVTAQVRKSDAYTIVEESPNGWGRLKSGAGWISLAYTERV